MSARAPIASYVLVAALFAACNRADPTAPVPQLRRVSAAESVWKEARLRNYTFVGIRYCFCLTTGEPRLVRVRDGVVVAVTNRRTGASESTQFQAPVDSLFALVRREARDLPSRLEVTYDARLGYPRRISYGQQELDGGGVIMLDSLRADP
jgi:hypothetical protein